MKDFILTMQKHGIFPKKESDVLVGAENALIEDSKGKKTIYYSLSDYGIGQYGRFYCCRTGVSGKWASRDLAKLAPDDRRAWIERVAKLDDLHKKKVIKEHKEIAEDVEKYLSTLKQSENYVYWGKKNVKIPIGIFNDNELCVIPAYDLTGKIWSYQTIDKTGFKLFRKGGRKSGTFFPIGDYRSSEKILVCEGVSTGCTLHEATGLPVLCAWDAGNLIKVASDLRLTLPKTKILICADNDQWTIRQPEPPELKKIDWRRLAGNDERWAKWRADGNTINIGVEKAKQAAVRSGSILTIPDIQPNDEDKKTDWNDIGIEATKEQITKVLEASGNATDYHGLTPHEVGSDFFITEKYENKRPKGTIGDLPFKALGMCPMGNYYYFSFLQKTIVTLSSSGHTMNSLLRLATLDDWVRWAHSKNLKGTPADITLYGTDELYRACEKNKSFSVEENVRGAGVWRDKGRYVIHAGDRLYVDGAETDICNFKSKYVYVLSQSVYSPEFEPLTNEEASKLRTLCEMPSWDNKMSGSLLAGWIVIAPFCGALSWRPHIWVTGEAGSGKSTVLDKVVKASLGDCAMDYNGGTTEAAIRQHMGFNARPIIYDEAETDIKGQVMAGVIELARKASFGGVVGKFGQHRIKAMFSVCFSSVNPPIKTFADETRISLLVLRKDKSPKAHDNFEKFKFFLNQVIDRDFAQRLFARTALNLPTLIRNQRTFWEAASMVLGNARAADQISPMLAGLYMLHSLDDISKEDAIKWVQSKDWTSHTTIAAEQEQHKLLRYIVTKIITISTSANGRVDVTIGEMILAALGKLKDMAPFSTHEASRMLGMYGIKTRNGGVIFSNKSENLKRLLSGTDWENGWSRQFLDIEGATTCDPTNFSQGDKKQRGVWIPEEYFTAND